MKPFLLLLAAVLVAHCDVARCDEVDVYLLSLLETQHLPSVAVTVVKNGEVVKSKGYGFADLENKTPATPQTVYLLASVTKQFTATAAMMLAVEGKLKLDDPIGNYLEGAPEAWKGITVRHLLTHTSGMGRQLAAVRSPGWFTSEHSRQEFIRLAAAQPVLFPPGEKFSYSNVGYALLGYVVEKAGGRPYWDFLRERIFEPLGMSATRNTDPTAIVPNRAGAYGWAGGHFANRIHPNPSTGFAAGCLTSTAEDMARWDAALDGEKLLPRAALRQMWTSARLNSGAETGYGFGWTIGDYFGHRTVAHSGSFEGASTHITRFLDDKLTVVVLINRDQADATGVANRVAAYYLPELISARGAPSQPDPDPARTSRLKRMLADIGGGADSAELTAGAKAWLRSGVPWVSRASAMLKNPDQFTFLRCDDARAAALQRNGSAIERTCFYRLGFGGRSIEWSFYLTPEGKVAALQPQR
jgi:CubicO group peptidase (beta-lactamase class C family)